MKRIFTSLAYILIVFLTIYYSFYSLMPQGTTKQTIHKNFSIEKSLEHLKEISKYPHYVSSKNHGVVRSYIVEELEKLGLEVSVQKSFAVNKKWNAAPKVQNVLARIKGTQKGKALLLLSHYDSSPSSSLGASDAGSGVVTILEGIRAFLSENKTFKNDIIICISDAEELGLLGAKAFVENHQWAKDVGLVLNFEARGSGGPSYMLMETNGGNQKLIQAFKRAHVPFPVASSLMYSIYKMLPNDTDLTVFRENGNIEGFNFAFIDDHYDYHSLQDSYERMDLNTLEHQASYLTSLLNYFSNANLEFRSIHDDVYFNFPFIGMVTYPFSWIVPMLLVLVVLFVLILFYGILWNKRLSAKNIIRGFIPMFLSLLSTGLIGFFSWRLILWIYPEFKEILHGFSYNGHLYITSVTVVSIALCFVFYKDYFKKYTLQDLLVTPLLLWIIINIGLAFYLKGGAYFIIPVFTMLIALVFLVIFERKNFFWFNTLLSIPVLLIFSPLVQMFPIGLGLKMLVTATVLTTLLFFTIIPSVGYHKFNYVGRLLLIIGFVLFVYNHFQSDFSIDRKRPNSILYLQDVNNSKAYWASYDSSIDSFTKQFLGDTPQEGSILIHKIASKYGTQIQKYTSAPMKKMDVSKLSLLKDTIVNEIRTVNLELVTPLGVNRVDLFSNFPLPLQSFSVNGVVDEIKEGKSFSNSKNTIISYYVTEPNERIKIQLSFSNIYNPKFKLMETRYDLHKNSQFQIKPRNNTMMPKPFVINDAIVTVKEFQLNSL